MRRILWKLQDLIDAALDLLSEDRRWKIIDFLMEHHLKNSCITAAVVWSMYPGDESFFDLRECDFCGTNPLGCYCGKERPL